MRLENVFVKCLEDVLKVFWRRLEDVLKTFLLDVFENVFKTYDEDK